MRLKLAFISCRCIAWKCQTYGHFVVNYNKSFSEDKKLTKLVDVIYKRARKSQFVFYFDIFIQNCKTHLFIGEACRALR